MRKRRIFYGLASLTLIILGCKPEFNQNAEYKDITVVYGLLNARDSVHYIKVYKTFLTDGSAIDAAQDLDNISYYDQIDVEVEEYLNGQFQKTISFHSTTEIEKDSGIFAYQPQVIYRSYGNLNEKALYKLKITNRNSGKEIIATTPLVGSFNISQPIVDVATFLTYHGTTTIKFERAENAVAYDIYLKFYYIEVDKATGDTITPNGVVSWKVTRSRSLNPSVTVDASLNQLYYIIASNLKKNDNIIRYTKSYDCVEIEVWAAEENYMIYVDMNEASNSIVQDRVMFTNLITSDKSAYGFFSSRNVAKRKYKLINSSQNHARDSLLYGSITGDLGFQ